MLCCLPLLRTAISVHTIHKIALNFIIISCNELVATSGLSSFSCPQLSQQWGFSPRPFHRDFISGWKENLIDTFLILRLASPTWPTREFPIQFHPQMGTATNPNAVLKLHKVNYVDNNISSGLGSGCVLSKAVKLCK